MRARVQIFAARHLLVRIHPFFSRFDFFILPHAHQFSVRPTMFSRSVFGASCSVITSAATMPLSAPNFFLPSLEHSLRRHKPPSASPPPTTGKKSERFVAAFARWLRAWDRFDVLSACNCAINSFLACERAVFDSALHATSHPPSFYPKQEASVALPAPSQPPKPEHP